MILELDFLQEVQILYERSVRLNRLQHSYTNRMDTVVAVLKADVSMFPFQQASFQEPDGLLSYLTQAKRLQLFDNGKILAADDVKQVLTLVTCSYEWNGARNIVVAVRDEP